MAFMGEFCSLQKSQKKKKKKKNAIHYLENPKGSFSKKQLKVGWSLIEPFGKQ